MVVDAAPLLGCPVVTTADQKLAIVDQIIFEGKEGKIFGFRVKQSGVLKRSAALEMINVITLERKALVVDTEHKFETNLKEFDEMTEHWGKVLTVKARTESKRNLGRVIDVAVDDQTGFITRFYLRDLWRERIIPRQFLVAITPKEIIFKDIVDQAIFDQAAASASVV